MARGTVTLTESVELLAGLVDELQPKVLAELIRIANDGVADMLAQFAEPKSGRVYGGQQQVTFTATTRKTSTLPSGAQVQSAYGRRVSFTANTPEHQASAPGEAPAIDTSNLANSITVEATGPTEVTIHVGADYAADLEFGTVHMAARPFVLPAVEHTIRPELQAMKVELGG